MSAVAARSEHANAYQRRRPEGTALYEIVRDYLETLTAPSTTARSTYAYPSTRAKSSKLSSNAACVPPPRFHTVKYAGVLAPASTWRARIKPRPEPSLQPTAAAPLQDDPPHTRGSAYRAWAELLKRTFVIDVLECPKCHEHMKLITLVLDLQSAARYLAKIGERVDVPARSKSRGPPYWKSTVLRRKAGG